MRKAIIAAVFAAGVIFSTALPALAGCPGDGHCADRGQECKGTECVGK